MNDWMQEVDWRMNWPTKNPFTDPCDCDACARFKKAACLVDDVSWSEDDDISLAVAAAQKSIWEARKKLHEGHREDRLHFKATGQHLDKSSVHELYIRSENEEEDRNEREDAVSEPTSAFHGEWSPGINSSEGKFMVCDHCRGHALPCNEAPVCRQCQYGATPCVHGWCKFSPDSINGCPMPKCRYAHADYLPVPFLEPNYSTQDYIILPGELRGYLYDGKLQTLEYQHPIVQSHHSDWSCKERQDNGRKEFDDAVRAGVGTLEHLYLPCGQFCGKAYGDDEEYSS